MEAILCLTRRHFAESPLHNRCIGHLAVLRLCYRTPHPPRNHRFARSLPKRNMMHHGSVHRRDHHPLPSVPIATAILITTAADDIASQCLSQLTDAMNTIICHDRRSQHCLSNRRSPTSPKTRAGILRLVLWPIHPTSLHMANEDRDDFHDANSKKGLVVVCGGCSALLAEVAALLFGPLGRTSLFFLFSPDPAVP